MDSELRDRLKEIEIEDFVFGIFIIIIILSYIANNFEKKYFINREQEDKETYYYLQIFIFFIVVLVNIYYVMISYKDVGSLSINEISKRKNYSYLNLIASLAALVASSIILYIAVTDVNIDAEISI